jgi:hypothetical protein
MNPRQSNLNGLGNKVGRGGFLKKKIINSNVMANSSSSDSIGTAGLLGVAFVVLKLTHVIDWSWWWVLLPFWGGLIIMVIVIVFILVYQHFKD